MYTRLFVCLLALLVSIPAFAQDKNSQAAKEKAEKDLATRMAGMAALKAEEEQRKAIVNDLINTYSECLKNAELFANAKEGSQQHKFYSHQTDQCYETLWVKIDKTPLEVLMPFTSIIKGTPTSDTVFVDKDDPRSSRNTITFGVKKAAFFRLYEAYQYGVQSASKATKP